MPEVHWQRSRTGGDISYCFNGEGIRDFRVQDSGFSRIVTCSHLHYAVLHFLKCPDARKKSDPRIFIANQSQSWRLECPPYCRKRATSAVRLSASPSPRESTGRRRA